MQKKNNKKYILITGGCGYIGSHTYLELIKHGYEPVILDNLSNSSENILENLKKITGVDPIFAKCDIRDTHKMNELFSSYNFNGIIHFAGLKSVSESETFPELYYENNVSGSIGVIKCAKRHNVNKIIFSSSATVYGVPENLPITEQHPLRPVNTYGRTKLLVENILNDTKDLKHSIVNLRYFNPIGAHSSGLIGDNPEGIPSNLMPYITRVALGKLKKLSIFGNDFKTRDGTGERDYIHVEDLANGHLKALNYAENNPGCFESFNLGTGKGTTVLELVDCFEKNSSIKIPFEFAPRREGDVSSNYADASKAKNLLNWESKKGLDEMCESMFKFETQNF